MSGASGYLVTPSQRRTLLAGPLGAVLVKPRGVPHAFWNPGDQRARLLEIIAPAGFEDYFAGLGDILARGSPDAARLADLAGRFGLDVDLGSIPRLAAAHGLRVPGGRPDPA
jgi:hypothetical protein